MSISSTNRKAGPFDGNGTASSFPFYFKVFEATDLEVVLLDVATSLETTLQITANYTVSLNANQDATPGGTVTLTAGALASGYKLTITSNIGNLQPTNLTNQGGFYPDVVEDALDRATIQIQQMSETLGRAVTIPISSTASTALPYPQGGTVIGWDDTGSSLVNLSPEDIASQQLYANWKYDTFTGDGTTTQFTLQSNPGNIANMDVSVSGVTQLPGTDYTLSGTTIAFTTAPALGLSILVRYGQATVQTNVTYSQEVFNVTSGTVDGTGKQTIFNLTSSYSPGNNGISVYLNGSRLVGGTDYTETAATQIVLSKGAYPGDVVLIITAEPINANVSDAAQVSYSPAGTGAVATNVQAKLRETVSVLDFDADPTGSTDSTTAFNNAKLYVAGLGGGIVHIPFGTYVLTNFDVDYQSVLFQGETSGYSYESETNSVRLVPSATAIYVARLKGTRGAITIGAGAYSGFKNVQFKYAAGTCNYGLFIDTGSTILEEVDIEGFPYGCVLATYANSNRFTNCSFTLNTKVGFAVPDSLSASTYMFPDVSNIPTGTNVSTAFSMLGCTFRQNDFGMVVRETTNVSIQNCVFESNTQAGLYFYRVDTSSLRAWKIQNCWFENNYEAYTSGSTSYSVNGNKLFTLGNLSTYIAWTSAYQAGYQFVIDSQTHAGGGPDTFEFDQCYVSGNTAAQKGFFIITGFKFALRQCVFTSGDTANFLKASNDAQGVMYIDPLMDNNPTTTITSITNGNGIGPTGAYYRMGTTNDGTPSGLGGLYPVKGVFGGPIRFPAPTVGDARNSDTRTLDDYFESTWTPTLGGTWTSNPVSLSGSYTKIGRLVTITLLFDSGTKSSATSGWITNLPYTVANYATGAVIDSNVTDRGSALVSTNGNIYFTNTTFGSGSTVSISYQTTT